MDASSAIDVMTARKPNHDKKNEVMSPALPPFDNPDPKYLENLSLCLNGDHIGGANTSIPSQVNINVVDKPSIETMPNLRFKTSATYQYSLSNDRSIRTLLA
jgi:hypothetical protein